jgi:hypothetical protein
MKQVYPVMQIALRSYLSAILCILLAAQSNGAQAVGTEPAPGSAPLKIERDSKLSLILTEPVSSATAKKGQILRLELQEPWVVEGQVILPQGTPVTGIVGSVQRAVPGKKNGHVVVTAGSIQLPSGQKAPLELWMPDRKDCDGEMGACIFVYGLWATLELPLIVVGLAAAHFERHSWHPNSGNTKPLVGVESELPAGSKVRAFTRRNLKLPAPSAANAEVSR